MDVTVPVNDRTGTSWVGIPPTLVSQSEGLCTPHEDPSEVGI